MDLWSLVGARRATIMELTREVWGAIGEGGVKTRRRLFAHLDEEVERYIDAMEAVVHPALARDARTEAHVADLAHEHRELRRHLDDLAAVPKKDGREWTRRYRAFVYALEHYFNLEEHGAFTVARSTLASENDALRLAFERELIAALTARRWHIPKAMVPERYGLSTGAVLATIAGVLGVAAAAVAWRMRNGEPDRTPRAIKERAQANRALREAQGVYLH